MQAQDVETITKRIYIITDGNFQQYKKGGLAIHAWYSDGGDISTWGNEAEHMGVYSSFNPSNSVAGLWFKDITFDKTKNIKIKVYDWSNDGWQSGEAEVTPSSNNYYRWYSTSGGSFGAVENSAVKYYAYLFDGSDWTTQEMSTEDGYIFTADIDNQTSYNNNLQVIFATSVVLDNSNLYTDQNGKWTTMYRPFEENQTPGFVNVTNLGGGCWADNPNSLKLNMPVHYRISYNPYEWIYSISPYFTRTIIGAESNGKYYATFSSDYNVAVPSGITAYYATQRSDDVIEMAAFDPDEGIASTDAAFLQRSSTETEFTFTPATTTRSGDNLMRKPNNGIVPGGNYVLANKSAGVGFYKITDDLGNQQNKAYLQDPGTGAPSFSIEIEGETTGIKVVNLEESSENNGQMYDLQGRRVAEPSKGVYIVNGKKVVIK